MPSKPKANETKIENIEPSFIEFCNNASDSRPYNLSLASTESINAKGWINWGRNNLYPNRLLELSVKSPMHYSILNLKAKMIGGNGFATQNWDTKTIQFLKNRQDNEYQNDDLDEILKKISADLVIFNAFALNIIWNKGNNGIAEINYLSPASIRFAYNKEDAENYVESYLVCDNWVNTTKNAPVPYPAYNPNDKSGSQILFYRAHNPSNTWYPSADYISGLDVIETDFEINQFHLSGIRNSFSPSVAITFPFSPSSDEQKRAIIEKSEREFKGSIKNGNPIYLFGKDKDNLPTIVPMSSNDTDKRFESLKSSVVENIAIAHQLNDKSILALNTPGALGQRNSMLESLSIFQATYIAGFQKLIEKIINKLAVQNDITQKLIIEKYSTNLSPDIPISDLLALLQSTISEEQKIAVLENKGFTREDALNLVNTPKNNDTSNG